MYAIVQHFQFTTSVEDVRKLLEDSAKPLLTETTGFRAFYFVEEDIDRGVVILMWETAKAAQQAISRWTSPKVCLRRASDSRTPVPTTSYFVGRAPSL